MKPHESERKQEDRQGGVRGEKRKDESEGRQGRIQGTQGRPHRKKALRLPPALTQRPDKKKNNEVRSTVTEFPRLASARPGL